MVDYNDLFDQPIFLLLKGQIAPMPMIVVSLSCWERESKISHVVVVVVT